MLSRRFSTMNAVRTGHDTMWPAWAEGCAPQTHSTWCTEPMVVEGTRADASRRSRDRALVPVRPVLRRALLIQCLHGSHHRGGVQFVLVGRGRQR